MGKPMINAFSIAALVYWREAIGKKHRFLLVKPPWLSTDQLNAGTSPLATRIFRADVNFLDSGQNQ